MPGKVFISCGQRGSEKKTAEAVKKLFEEEFGLSTYLAFQVQSLDDIMVITKELRTSDYYLMIDFKRNPNSIEDLTCSLFTHQELALAHHLGFGSDMIVLQQEGAPLEGFLKYVLSNPKLFKDETGLIEAIRQLVLQKEWSSEYSRNLLARDLSYTDCWYSDHTGKNYQRVWQIMIENRRPDSAALGTVCILDAVKYPNGLKEQSKDRAYLKWAGQAGYERTILPKDFGIVDVLAIRPDQRGVFLHSLRDTPRAPIVGDDGEYEFFYKVYAREYSVVEFSVKIELNWAEFAPDKWQPSTTAELVSTQ
jgi:hypothetical protein